MKNPIKINLSINRLLLISPAILAFSALQGNAALIAYEDFNYGGGVNLTTETANNGTGWTAAWASNSGVNGLITSGSGQSLGFTQSPALITDGSTHVFSDSSRGNSRDFTTSVNLATTTMYFTALVRDFGGGASAGQMRAEFYSGAAATGNLRANVGISGGTLFADGINGGYGVGTALASAFATDTTYLLAMKRTGSSIFASLIPANGDLSTLAAEPTTWQVQNNQVSGVTFNSMRLLTNVTAANSGGLRIDELRIATDWNSAVNGLMVPEPGSATLLGLGALSLLLRRKR